MSQPDGSPNPDAPAFGAGEISSLASRDAHLVQITEASLADAAHRAGPHLYCHPGCTPCCHGAFAINALDAARLRRGLAELAINDPVSVRTIAARARLYLEEFSPSFPGDPETGILHDTEAAREAFEDFANDAPCPALDPESGLCQLYTARPMTCRIFGPPVRSRSEDSAEEGLSVCELCFTQASPEEIAAAEMEVPHAEEQALLSELGPEETIVAFCLAPHFPAP